MQPPTHTRDIDNQTKDNHTQNKAGPIAHSTASSSTPDNAVASSASECTTQQELSEKAIERLVQQCPELSILRACNNGITHVHGSIQRLQNLEVLDLRNNRIHDISFLTKLPHLREVDVRGCPISNNVPFKDLVQHIRSCCPWIARINGVDVEAANNNQLVTSSDTRPSQINQQVAAKSTAKLDVWQQKVFELLINLRMRERAWLDAQRQWKQERQYLLKTVHSQLQAHTQGHELHRCLEAAQTISSVAESVEQQFQKFEYAVKSKLRTLGHRADTAKLHVSSMHAKVEDKYEQLSRLCKHLKTEWTELQGDQIFDSFQSNDTTKGKQEDVELQLVDSFDSSSLRSFCKELIGRKYALLRQVKAMEDQGHSQCKDEINSLKTKLDDVENMYEEEKRSREKAEEEVDRVQTQLREKDETIAEYTKELERSALEKRQKIEQTVSSTNSELNRLSSTVSTLEDQKLQLTEENETLRAEVEALRQKQSRLENKKIEALESSLESAKKRIQDLEHERRILMRQCSKR